MKAIKIMLDVHGNYQAIYCKQPKLGGPTQIILPTVTNTNTGKRKIANFTQTPLCYTYEQ